MYRKDVLEGINYMLTNEKEEDRPNFAELGRRWGCDYRTAKAAWERARKGETGGPKRPKKPSVLDPYKVVVEQKLGDDCKVTAIYYFIRKRGYAGKLTTLKNYCKQVKEERERVAIARFETLPGHQAQVDWKEEMMLRSRSGEHVVFNIFLMIMGYSRRKFVCLTIDRSQDTLFQCLVSAIEYFGGSPEEVLFDNMKTAADRSRSEFGKGVVNERLRRFARDALFEPRLCRAFRPQTKGKVEDLAKLTERLRPFDGEFDSIDDLASIVAEFRDDINAEVSQATGRTPNSMAEKEKERLRRPDLDLIRATYLSIPVERKVGRDSMVTYRCKRYSVEPRYIGKTVTLDPKDGELLIYFSKQIIARHAITDRPLNYDRGHYESILRSGAMKDCPEEAISKAAERNLAVYDEIW